MTKTSNLVECYRELLAGAHPKTLFEKYVRVEVLAALELRQRGVTLEQLQDFVKKRDAHIKKMLGEKEELWLAVRE